MVQHDVMIKLKEMPAEEKEKNCRKLKEILEGLKKEIPQIKTIHVGINISPRPIAFDLISSSTFETPEDLESFRNHKAHLKAVDFINTIQEQSVLVDHII